MRPSQSATVTVQPGCFIRLPGTSAATGSAKRTQTPRSVEVPKVTPLSLNEPRAPMALNQR